ncbi:hypothetical protein FACS1894108_01960 [Planctomycetales bacterium]|nr:hypothetical protein FACS1894108_01960 [Planctomycetales bacterium]GHV20384.1 hypothetical protein AGMMS49959_07590 [Planctomycetales bacterium]
MHKIEFTKSASEFWATLLEDFDDVAAYDRAQADDDGVRVSLAELRRKIAAKE